jgi:hypothetical protein
MPFGRSGWVDWLEANDVFFRATLESAASARKVFNMKTKPLPSTFTRVASRVSPVPEKLFLRLLVHQEDGLYCLSFTGRKMIVYMVGIGYDVQLILLEPTPSNREYQLRRDLPLWKQLEPAATVFRKESINEAEEISLFKLTVAVASIDRTGVMVTILGAVPTSVKKHAPTTSSSTGECDLDDEEYFIQSVEAKILDYDTSDMGSCCGTSSAEEEKEVDALKGGPSDASSSSEDEGAALLSARAIKGTHTMYSNGYFTFTNNPDFNDIKVHIVPRWCTDDHLGTTNMSRTIRPMVYSESKDTTIAVSFIVLKVWMLDRAMFNNFASKRSTRVRLFAKERKAVRDAIVGMSSRDAPTTGNAAADTFIRAVAPGLLLAE